MNLKLKDILFNKIVVATTTPDNAPFVINELQKKQKELYTVNKDPVYSMGEYTFYSLYKKDSNEILTTEDNTRDCYKYLDAITKKENWGVVDSEKEVSVCSYQAIKKDYEESKKNGTESKYSNVLLGLYELPSGWWEDDKKDIMELMSLQFTFDGGLKVENESYHSKHIKNDSLFYIVTKEDE